MNKNKTFTAYKKIFCKNEYGFLRYAIATLEISKRSKRVMTSYKCRSATAKVVKIEVLSSGWYSSISNEKIKKGYSNYNPNPFVYEVGKIVRCKPKFDPNPNQPCSAGIHWFLNKHDALNYLI